MIQLSTSEGKSEEEFKEVRIQLAGIVCACGKKEVKINHRLSEEARKTESLGCIQRSKVLSITS